MKKVGYGAGATLTKTKSSRAGPGAVFMKRRTPELELCHFYDGSAALPWCHVHKASHWQQGTIEITWWDHSVIACLRHMYIGVILHAQPVCGELHIQCHANGEVATTSPLNNEPHQSHMLFSKIAPLHGTILLRSENPSGKCAKLHNVAASNNRCHLTRSPRCHHKEVQSTVH